MCFDAALACLQQMPQWLSEIPSRSSATLPEPMLQAIGSIPIRSFTAWKSTRDERLLEKAQERVPPVLGGAHRWICPVGRVPRKTLLQERPKAFCIYFHARKALQYLNHGARPLTGPMPKRSLEVPN